MTPLSRLERIDVALRLVAAEIASYPEIDSALVIDIANSISPEDLGTGLLGVACGFAETLADMLNVPVTTLMDAAIITNQKLIMDLRNDEETGEDHGALDS